MNNINDVGRGPLRFGTNQGRDEERPTRAVCPAGLYLLPHFRHGNGGWSGHLPGRDIFSVPGTRKADWALSALNLNHQFTASVTYDLPFGKGKQFGSGWNSPTNAVLGNWEVDVIQRAQSGLSALRG